MEKVKRKYLDFEGDLTILPLNMTDELIEKIRLERESMEENINGSIMTSDEIRHYLNEGFTISTYQADYVKEGFDFAYDEVCNPLLHNRKSHTDER